jgi:hypothetical protein
MPSIPTIDALVLSGLFGAFGLWQFAGIGGVRQTYKRWRYPANTHLVAGLAALLVALFLADPITRIWGVILGAFVMFVVVASLLSHGRYGWSVPGIAVMVALVPATLAGPLS